MKRSLFAFQVFLPLVPEDDLRARLHGLIARAPDGATFAQKRELYAEVVRLLLPAVPSFVWGNWDYTNDDAEAEREYESWCQGTIADARERARERASPGEQRYLFVTLLFLLQRQGSCDRILERLTAMPEEDLWRRATFHRLLSAILTLNFASVAGDAIYLCPGEDELGLTEAEMGTDRYAYLHRLT